MIQTTRAIARRVLPDAVKRMLWYAGSAEYRRCRREVSEILRATNEHVAAGPFAGLSLAGFCDVAAIVPKLLGTFERELFPAIESICTNDRHDLLVDIGAAEGFYSVGFARRMPGLRVICFEAIESERRRLAQLADQNGVRTRILIEGLCTPPLLADALARGQRPLVKCDVEGAEFELLDPNAVGALRHAEIVVELHELRRPGVSQAIHDRFAPTHEIVTYHTHARQLTDWPASVHVPRAEAVQYLDEGRQGQMSWYWMTPREVKSP